MIRQKTGAKPENQGINRKSLILIALTIVSQPTLNLYSPFNGYGADFIYLVLCFFANQKQPPTGFRLGILCGLAVDCFSQAPFGFYSLIFSITGLLAGLSHNKLILGNYLFSAAFAATLTLLKKIAETVLTLVLANNSSSAYYDRTILWEIALNAFFFALFVPILKKISS